MDGIQPGGVPMDSARQHSFARIELPTDYRRAEGIAVRAALLEVSLDAQQCQILALATQRLNVELADAVIAAFAVLLHRHSQQTELSLDVVTRARGSEGPSRPQTLASRACRLSFADDSTL